MASPHPTAKPTVNLAPNPASKAGPRVSRIRRDPPPPVAKKELELDPEEREQWTVILGIMVFGLAIFAIILGFSSYSASSPPSEYTIEMKDAD